MEWAKEQEARMEEEWSWRGKEVGATPEERESDYFNIGDSSNHPPSITISAPVKYWLVTVLKMH